MVYYYITQSNDNSTNQIFVQGIRKWLDLIKDLQVSLLIERLKI